MIKIGDKKAQGLSVNMIILIILGVAVLVLAILGFTLGWSSLTPWIDSKNIDTIVKTCNTKCALGNKYDFCNANLESALKDEKGNEIITSCYALANIPEFNIYGINKCSNINCQPESECQLIKININNKEFIGEEKDNCDENDIDISDIAKGKSSDSTSTLHCCLIGAKSVLKK